LKFVLDFTLLQGLGLQYYYEQYNFLEYTLNSRIYVHFNIKSTTQYSCSVYIRNI